MVWGWLAVASGCGDSAAGDGSTGTDASTTAPDGTTTASTSSSSTAGTSASGPTSSSIGTDDASTSDSGDEATASTTGDALPCNADGGDPNRDRFVVISHPYGADGSPASTFEVLALASDGELSRTGTTFELGRATFGEVVFTPNGRFGMVAQDDGSVGVLELDDAGQVTVVDAAFAGEFYATGLVMAEDGDVVWLLETQTQGNGGGTRRIAIGCDGLLADEGTVAPADVPYGLALLGDGRALVGARSILDDATVPGANAYLLDWDNGPTVLAAAVAFDMDDPILSAVTLTADRRFGVLADNSAFSLVPNRIAVVQIGDGDSLTFVQELGMLDDPYDVVTSPFDDAALFTSGFGDAIVVMSYDPTGAPPFSIRGELEYLAGGPALPGNAVMLDRGDLRGRVLVAENVAVRQIQFEGDGVVTDLGTLELGDGLTEIVGVIGVQP